MLIALHQIIIGGETRRVLVNPSSIYVASATDGGTMVSTIIGTIRVTETPEEIEQKVSLKTQAHTENRWVNARQLAKQKQYGNIQI